MNLKNRLKELKQHDLNCNVFDVYSYNGLSMQELLCQFFTKINECVKVSNDTLNLSEWLVNEGLSKEVIDKLLLWYEDGTLEQLINTTLFENLNNKIDNNKNELNSKIDDNKNELNNNINKINEKIDFVYPEMFGAIGDGINDDSNAFNKMFETGKRVKFIKDGIYKVGNILSKNNMYVESEYNTTIKIFQNSTNPVLLGFGSNSTWKNIKFYSLEPSLEWNRGDLTSKENVYLENCLFTGFQHNSSLPNAWGLYLDKSKNITIRNCYFDHNSQSDIAIVDKCENILIDNCKGSKLHINIEPNGEGGIKNIRVNNCNIDRINTLENSFLYTCIESVTISNCDINQFTYKGGNVYLSNTKVTKYTNTNLFYLGDVKGELNLSEDIIKDRKLYDIGNSESDDKQWFMGYTPITNNIERSKDSYGESLTLNPNNENTTISINTKVNVTPGSTYCFSLTSRSIYSSSSSWISNHGYIRGLAEDGSEVFNNALVTNQSTINTTTPVKTKKCFIEIPSNVTKLQISLSNTKSGVTSQTKLQIYDVTLKEVVNSIDSSLYEDKKVYTTSIPSLLNCGGTKNVYLKGDEVYIKNPSPGSYRGYICTSSGNPGVWKGFDLIEV